GATGGGAVHRGGAEQVRCGGRSRAAGSGGAGSARAAEELRVPGRQCAGDSFVGAGGLERGREVGEADRRADGGGGQQRAAAGARTGQALPDADRRHLLDLGAGNGGDGANRAGEDQGGRGSGNRGLPGDAQDGGHGRGNVQEAAGRGAGGGQRRVAAARDRQGRRGAGHGAGEDGIDHAAHQVQGGGLHPDEGRRRTAYAGFQGIPPAVLSANDRR